MKTFLILCLSFCVSSAALAADVYPTITPELQSKLKSLPGFVSENQKAHHGDYVAVTGPQGSNVYQLIMRDVNYFPGCKEPVLISVDLGEKFSPNENVAARETGSGTGTFSGFTGMLGQEIHFSCSNTSGPWSCVITWGEGSDVNNPGKDITHTGRKLGDPVAPATNPPVTTPVSNTTGSNEAYSFAKPLLTVSSVNGQPVIVCTLNFNEYDYTLQSSPDMTSWENTPSASEQLPGSNSTATILKIFPNAPSGNGFGNKAFFRIVSNKK